MPTSMKRAAAMPYKRSITHAAERLSHPPRQSPMPTTHHTVGTDTRWLQILFHARNNGMCRMNGSHRSRQYSRNMDVIGAVTGRSLITRISSLARYDRHHQSWRGNFIIKAISKRYGLSRAHYERNYCEGNQRLQETHYCRRRGVEGIEEIHQEIRPNERATKARRIYPAKSCQKAEAAIVSLRSA